MPNNKDNKKAYLFMYCLVYLIIFFICLHIGAIMNRNPEIDIFSAFYEALENFNSAPLNFFPITFVTLKIIFFGTVLFVVVGASIWFEIEKDAKRARKDENGSAKWNDELKEYNEKFTDPIGKAEKNGPNNMILNSEVYLSMNTRKTLRNNNILVIGGSGSGKSRFFVKPNILQANCSYVITDPSGELLTSQGKFLEDHGYKIKVFNLVDMEHSNCYNPFNYIRDELGVLMLVNCLIKNTTPPGKGGGDPFWEKSETALLQALIFYLIKYRPKEEQNFTSVMKLLRAAEVDENNPSAKSPLDRLFDEVQRTDPKSIALKQYMTFKMGAGKTLKSILISCAVRLTVFNMREIENLTGTDNIDLGTLGDEKQALFVVIPAADDTYNFLVSMMYSQLFETLYYHAEIECPNGYYIQDKDGSNIRFCKTEEDAKNYLKEHSEYKMKKGDKHLASHCRFLLDEFANIGQIPEFDKKLATMRKYEISCSIILQNLAQIKEMYDKKAEGLIGNCDTILFLGSSEYETCEYISKKLGKATIVVRDNSRNMGAKGGSSLSYKKSGRELMTPDEVSRMDNSECIVFIRGLQAFKSKKFDYPKHKNYKYTGDADIKNIYDYEEKFNNRLSVEKTLMVTSTSNSAEYHIQKVGKTSSMKEGLQTMNQEISKSAEPNLEKAKPENKKELLKSPIEDNSKEKEEIIKKEPEEIVEAKEKQEEINKIPTLTRTETPQEVKVKQNAYQKKNTNTSKNNVNKRNYNNGSRNSQRKNNKPNTSSGDLEEWKF